MKTLYLLVFFFTSHVVSAQQAFYDVTAGVGNGIRFWHTGAPTEGYKIHMGTGTEYQFGPVTSYSIKMNMSNNVDRGWTWGVQGAVPIAAIATNGNMQIAGSFFSGGNVGIATTSPRGKFDVDGPGDIYLSDDVNAGGNQSVFLPGHIYLSPYNGTNLSYLQARRLDNSGTTSLRIRTYNSGSLVESMHIEGNGNVGIGTVTPAYKLDVTGPANDWKARFQGPDGYITIGPANSGFAHIYTDRPSFIFNANIWSHVGGFSSYNTANLFLQTHGTTRLTILNSNGNVGIGTQNPNEKLTVNGTIYGKEVKVDLSVPGPDYVFEKDYDLPSLEEIKIYIEQHKHLPEVPSASELEKDGISLGEMNMILLKKVEEITLYLLEQQEKMRAQDKEIQLLKDQIK